ncbi:energy-coupling factor transporter transmembrane component T family protein [Egbenema bharatensis]|uniref:energy-coupling factor transporter transmembrane component T family protein n=1 Tax=Egbenema bharatensis TaxID=3463334 RepID=UPI003A83C083
MTLGLYIHRRSLIHRLAASTKLLMLAAMGIWVALIPDLLGFVPPLTIAGLGCVLSRLPLRPLWEQIHPVFWLFAGILLIYGISGDWTTGAIAVLRFLVLILFASLITLTTRVSDMVEAIEQALQPFQRFGIHPGKISLMIALALRLIPVLLDQVRQIQEAQQARGIDRPILALLVPLFIKTLRMADELSDAIEARGFEE